MIPLSFMGAIRIQDLAGNLSRGGRPWCAKCRHLVKSFWATQDYLSNAAVFRVRCHGAQMETRMEIHQLRDAKELTIPPLFGADSPLCATCGAPWWERVEKNGRRIERCLECKTPATAPKWLPG